MRLTMHKVVVAVLAASIVGAIFGTPPAVAAKKRSRAPALIRPSHSTGMSLPADLRVRVFSVQRNGVSDGPLLPLTLLAADHIV